MQRLMWYDSHYTITKTITIRIALLNDFTPFFFGLLY